MMKEPTYRFAKLEAPAGLFKFRPYGNDDPERRAKQKDRVWKTVRDGQIYFAYPTQFNDPFEASPKFKSRLSKRDLRHHWAKIAGRAGRRMGRPLRERLSKIEEVRGKDPRKLLADLENTHRERTKKGCVIYCLSADKHHLLQWSHYAAGHSGVCIAFNSERLPISGAIAVEYSTEYPSVEFPLEDDKFLLERSVFTKSEVWAYEREFRLFSLRLGNPAWDLGIKWEEDKQTAVVSPECITGLVLGARMPESDREELLAKCREWRPDIWIEQARTSKDTYSLEFERLK